MNYQMLTNFKLLASLFVNNRFFFRRLYVIVSNDFKNKLCLIYVIVSNDCLFLILFYFYFIFLLMTRYTINTLKFSILSEILLPIFQKF